MTADDVPVGRILYEVFGWVGFLALILVALIYVYRDKEKRR